MQKAQDLNKEVNDEESQKAIDNNKGNDKDATKTLEQKNKQLEDLISKLQESKNKDDQPVLDFETLKKTLQESNEFLTQNNQNNDFKELKEIHQSINSEYEGYKSQDVIDTRNKELQDELQKAKNKLLAMQQKQQDLQKAIEDNKQALNNLNSWIKDNEDNLDKNEKQDLENKINENQKQVQNAINSKDDKKINDLTKDLKKLLEDIKNKVDTKKQQLLAKNRQLAQQAQDLNKDKNDKDVQKTIENNKGNYPDSIKTLGQKNKQLEDLISKLQDNKNKEESLNIQNELALQKANELLAKLKANKTVKTDDLIKDLNGEIEKDKNSFPSADLSQKQGLIDSLNQAITRNETTFNKRLYLKALNDAKNLNQFIQDSPDNNNPYNTQLPEVINSNTLSDNATVAQYVASTEKLNATTSQIQAVLQNKLNTVKTSYTQALNNANEALSFLKKLNAENPKDELSEAIKNLSQAIEQNNSVDSNYRKPYEQAILALNKTVEDAKKRVKELETLSKENYEKWLAKDKQLQSENQDKTNIFNYLDKVIKANSNFKNPTTQIYDASSQKLQNAYYKATKMQEFEKFAQQADESLKNINLDPKPDYVTKLESDISALKNQFNKLLNDDTKTSDDLVIPTQQMSLLSLKAKLALLKEPSQKLLTKVTEELTKEYNDIPKQNLSPLKQIAQQNLDLVNKLLEADNITEEQIKSVQNTIDSSNTMLQKVSIQNQGLNWIKKIDDFLANENYDEGTKQELNSVLNENKPVILDLNNQTSALSQASSNLENALKTAEKKQYKIDLQNLKNKYSLLSQTNTEKLQNSNSEVLEHVNLTDINQQINTKTTTIDTLMETDEVKRTEYNDLLQKYNDLLASSKLEYLRQEIRKNKEHKKN
ncbi:hypothetical protein ACWXVT_02260 [Mycoplasma sp. 1573]